MNLAEQFRPRIWSDIVGQNAAVQAVRRIIARGPCDCKQPCTCRWGGRAWWITGESGVGKTTIAKLIAAEGAHPLCIEEHTAGDLSPKGVRELENSSRLRSLATPDGWAFIVNECHGLAKHTVRALLDVLERIPPHVCWLFTTTRKGQESFFEDDQDGDAAPLVSRCQELRLAGGPAIWPDLARRAKAVAVAANMDGLPDEVYSAAIAACRGNLRAVLQRVESGQLRDEALGFLRQRLQAVPLDGRHEGERSRLQALIAKLGDK